MCKNSNHPLARSILQNYDDCLFEIESSEKKGYGLKAIYNNKEIFLGKAEFCDIKEVKLDEKEDYNLNFYMKYDGDELIFTFSDEIKKDAKEAIKTLVNSGKKIILLSGDNGRNVTKIAKNLEIDEFYSDQTPLDKANFLQNLQKNNKQFLMVGDGINDAPALALADVSLSFNQASDLAQNISDIIIQGNKLMPIIDLIQASKKSLKLMRQNLQISLFYNVIAIPFAISGYITPLIAALAMSSSSILVLLNSLRNASADR